ncbi:hypothetical protein [Streptomyces botrytidirepellens]
MFADPASRTKSAVTNGCIQVGYFIVGIRAAGLAAGGRPGWRPDR